MEQATMRLGVAWPLPFANHGDEMPWFEGLRRVRLDCGASDLRINLDIRRRDPLGLLAHIRSAGLEPLPILHGDAASVLSDLQIWGTWCGEIASACPDVEIWNEPANDSATPGNLMPPGEYARVVRAAAAGIRAANPATRIWIAMDGMDLGRGRFGTYHRVVRQEVPRELYDGVAVHPYRGAKDPNATAFGTRREEWTKLQQMAGEDVPIWVTEIGYSIYELSGAEQQAEYLMRELMILKELAAVGACVYAHQGPHGVFDGDWTPRPAVYRLAQFAALLQEGQR